MLSTQFYTPEEVCSLLRINRRMLDRLVHDRQIAFVRVSHRLRFSEEDVTAYLRRQRVPEDAAATWPDSGRPCTAARPKSAPRVVSTYKPGDKVV